MVFFFKSKNKKKTFNLSERLIFKNNIDIQDFCDTIVKFIIIYVYLLLIIPKSGMIFYTLIFSLTTMT